MENKDASRAKGGEGGEGGGEGKENQSDEHKTKNPRPRPTVNKNKFTYVLCNLTKSLREDVTTNKRKHTQRCILNEGKINNLTTDVVDDPLHLPGVASCDEGCGNASAASRRRRSLHLNCILVDAVSNSFKVQSGW